MSCVIVIPSLQLSHQIQTGTVVGKEVSQCFGIAVEHCAHRRPLILPTIGIDNIQMHRAPRHRFTATD
jgi:hypothetical protein